MNRGDLRQRKLLPRFPRQAGQKPHALPFRPERDHGEHFIRYSGRRGDDAARQDIEDGGWARARLAKGINSACASGTN